MYDYLYYNNYLNDTIVNFDPCQATHYKNNVTYPFRQGPTTLNTEFLGIEQSYISFEDSYDGVLGFE